MRRRTFLSIILIQLMIVAGVAQIDADYNPMRVGNYWIQHTDSIFGEYQPTTMRMEVEGTDFIGDMEYFCLKQWQYRDDAPQDSSVWYIWTGQDSTGGLMGAFGEGPGLDSALIYDPPIQTNPIAATTVGYSWDYVFPGTGMGDQHWFCTLESIAETVDVPAGMFSNCIKMDIIITDTLSDTIQTMHHYYAPDVGQVLNVGWSRWGDMFKFELTDYFVHSSVDSRILKSVPNHFRLLPNYPNPFNPVTTINYSLPQQAKVNLAVFNIRGQEVMRLQDTEKPPGNFQVLWNGLDQSGIPVSTGVYFCRLTAGSYTQTIKMVYLR